MGTVIYASRARALKALRSKSQFGLDECKRALEKTDWDAEKAYELLQGSAQDKADSKAGRAAHEGRIVAFDHLNRIAGIVEVNCETDFAANTTEFRQFCENLSIHIVGAGPKYVSETEITDEDMRRQAARLKMERPGISEQDFDDLIELWYDEVCLLRQKHIVPAFSDKTIEQLRQELSAKLGENVIIRRFVRWEMR